MSPATPPAAVPAPATAPARSAPPAADVAAHAPALSVVIPACDEAPAITALLDEVAAALAAGPAHEIVVVDDGSTDATLAHLHAYREAHPAMDLRIIRHPRNLGQSAALWTGIASARAPWIATLDGDGQNDPADIPALFAVVDGPDPRAGVRLVCGQRRRRRDSLVKRCSSRVANAVRAALLGDGTPDTGCGLKLIERRTFLSLPRFDHMHRFLPALVRRTGAGCISVPVNHRPRTAGRSKYNISNRLWVGIVDLAGVMWLERRRLDNESEEV